jgi:hypothetical protein
MRKGHANCPVRDQAIRSSHPIPRSCLKCMGSGTGGFGQSVGRHDPYVDQERGITWFLDLARPNPRIFTIRVVTVLRPLFQHSTSFKGTLSPGILFPSLFAQSPVPMLASRNPLLGFLPYVMLATAAYVSLRGCRYILRHPYSPASYLYSYRMTARRYVNGIALPAGVRGMIGPALFFPES